MCRVGWFERRVTWSLSRGEGKVNIWEKVSAERGPDGHLEKVAALKTEVQMMEEHRQHLASNLNELRENSTSVIQGLEANADLFAEEAEEIAGLLWNVQRENHDLNLKYEQAIEWKNHALAERDRMWRYINV